MGDESHTRRSAVAPSPPTAAAPPSRHPAPPRHARPAARRPPPVARDRRPRPHARPVTLYGRSIRPVPPNIVIWRDMLQQTTRLAGSTANASPLRPPRPTAPRPSRRPSPATRRPPPAARDHTPAPSPCMGEAFARFPLTSSYGGTCSSRRRGWREARRMLRPYAHPAPPRHARPAARRPPPVARDRRPRPHARRPPSITPRPSSIFRRVDAPGASCYPGCNAMMKPSSREGRVTANRRWCEGGTRRSGEDPSERGEERLPLHSVAGR
jgi:hypothetical protein